MRKALEILGPEHQRDLLYSSIAACYCGYTDLIIVDSPYLAVDEVKKYKPRAWLDYMSVRHKSRGTSIIMDNRWCKDDLTEHIRDSYTPWSVIQFPIARQGVPLCPEIYSENNLSNLELELGADRFDAMFMQRV